MEKPTRGRPDFLMLLITFTLVGFGLLMVFSTSAVSASVKYHSSFYFVNRQILWSVAGTITMLFFMNVPFQKLHKRARTIFAAALILLLLVLLVGIKINGHRSWFGVGSFGIQPTEFAKLGLLTYVASLLSKKGERIREFRNGLLPVLLIIGTVAGLIMLQPDIGSDLVILISTGIVVVSSGASILQIIGIGLCAVPLAVVIVFNKAYRLERFTSFLHPWSDAQDSSYQLAQSLTAFGHGGLTGAGFGKGVEKMFYLPEAHTDFIFSTIGEELGFIGCSVFLLLYLILIWRGLLAATRCPEPFGMYLGIGIISTLGVQALINLGGVTGSIPITGVPLPLISYGGSSLLISMASIGILLNISREGRIERV
ncbi:stage V sporulation protein E [Gordoniibacillus kamchatkensis]|uniref:Probable peptidoglycan glycosyltransferase FtsW n=1 Tax=Gordoniibacillus kamchatkensis TaxID=1590651 RepID=A0ABR5AJX7_9BACL|nr:putative lipid II flippase FtsW [Paenibacillus sp. VKM B-2647]KIL41342.1 stage V sporulation protein E [Paenibacillus sp. VKM B-2647]